LAPEQSDRLVMGTSVQWYAVKEPRPSSFPACPWAVQFDDKTCAKTTKGDWDWETGAHRDQVDEVERIRDYAFRVTYGNWATLKNHPALKDRYAGWRLSWVAYIGGKRESRRLMGDVVLRQQDIVDGRAFPDACVTTTWTIDLHYPKKPACACEAFRSEARHLKIKPYPIPYRCLYSRNVDNLLMAGRNISVTHVALGTVRVQRTTGMMGEVLGMASSICRKHSCDPRDVYEKHLAELKELLKAGVPKVPGTADSDATSKPAQQELLESIGKQTLRRNRDGSGITWFHPRACVVPSESGQPTVLMTLQEIGGSDYFGPVHWSETDDVGKTWTDPAPIPPLGRVPVEGHPGLMAGVCDVTPQFHPPTGTVLALGHVVFYRGPRFSRGDQLARYPVYAVRRRDGSWSERKILHWDDPRGGHIYTNNCGQRVVMPNGDVMMSFTFGPEPKNRMVAGVRCSFDGEELKILEVGPPLENNVGRGLLEPSVTRFRDRFYITIRAEDGHGYVAVSDDGLNYRRKTAWAWDDGRPIAMSTTQQHWLTHSDGLLLVYTRKDASNTNVIRWRSPLWVARVDTERLCLIRESERVILPLMGNDVEEPDDVALMGNFGVVNVGRHESWVTVGEWMPRRAARGDLLLSRIRWTRPNTLVRESTERGGRSGTFSGK
jgi:hypothetical protein